MFSGEIYQKEVEEADVISLRDFEAGFENFSGESYLKCSSSDDVEVSIICITYNHRQFIERTMYGFLHQRFNYNIEILVFDDCSDDGTAEIVQSYADKNPDLIRLEVQPYNKFSRGEARPHLFFERARGKYIAYCEGDDFWINDNKVALQYDYLEKNTHVSLVYGAAVFINHHSEIMPAFSSETNYLDHSKVALEVGVNLFTLSAMFRNKFPVLDVRGRNVYLDIILWSQCGEIGVGHFMQELQPCAYRVHSQGLNSQASQAKRFRMLVDTYTLLFFHKIRGFRGVAVLILLKLIVAKLRLIYLRWREHA